MTDDNLNPDEDFSDIESALKSLRPRAVSGGFADRAAVEPLLKSVSPTPPGEDFAGLVSVECTLATVTPREPSEGFADRTVAASVSGNTVRIIPFVRRWAPLAAAAALAVALLPAVLRDKPAAPAQLAEAPAPVATVASANPDLAPGFPEEAMSLPVVNLPDGRAYRPVLRERPVSTEDFRAGPGGVVMPVSLSAKRELEYQPVTFE